jgi:hypothetical protein
VGKSEIPFRMPYLQNDKQQDGGSRDDRFLFLLLIIIGGWIGQSEIGCIVKFYALFAKIITF